MFTPEEIIKAFNMKPLENEGGYFAETYRSKDSTAIYYLLTRETFSAMHRLSGDEIWHFYIGDPVEMLQLHPDGGGEAMFLGNASLQGQRMQVMVPGGTWQGSRLVPGGTFALFGTTMAPPFTLSEFALGERTELLKKYPVFTELITKLTR